MSKIILADAFFKTSSVTVGDSGGLVHACFVVLIIGICLAAIWFVGYLGITKLAAKYPGPATVIGFIWNGFFILVGLIIVVNFLMSLIGRGFMVY